MDQLNRNLAPEIETVYGDGEPQVSFVSSSGVKEIASFGKGGRTRPERVARRFAELYPKDDPGPQKTPRSRLPAHGRTGSDRQARRPRAQREGRALTDQVRIDREEIYDILDQMRATIPEEIKQALDRQGTPGHARGGEARGRPVTRGGREQAVREASQTEIVKLAERQARTSSTRRAAGARDAVSRWRTRRTGPLHARGQPREVPHRGQARARAAARRSQEHVMAGVSDAATNETRTSSARRVSRR